MIDYKKNIADSIDIKNKTGLISLLGQNIKYQRMLNSMELTTPAVELKVQLFIRGLSSVLSELAQKDKLKTSFNIIQSVFSHLGVELSTKECVVLFALRDLGRFKIKDSKLYSELTTIWSVVPELRIDESELELLLKELKNVKILEVRRGSVSFKDSIIFSI